MGWYRHGVRTLRVAAKLDVMGSSEADDSNLGNSQPGEPRGVKYGLADLESTGDNVDSEHGGVKHEMSSDSDEDDDEDKKKNKRPVSATIPKGVRYLKKSDGEPFWRKDIQYDFLEALFENDQRVFTNLFAYCTVPGFYEGPQYTFAELYVRTLAESPKCSKILKERLLKDFEMGKSVAKVCLLVNTGRMNTTINFVPEMRSTLRTYHSIPSLQADPLTGGSKPLQDTPRLKSILKAVSDSKEDFKTIEDLLASPPLGKPNTNLVLLLFLFSNNVNGIKYHHVHTDTCNHHANSFMEFFLETKIHPANRAQRFLWLVYTYLETNFQDDEVAKNPFGGSTMPGIELVPDSDLNNFDKDTDYEIEYSDKMFRTRLKYLADEEHNNNPKRGNKLKREKDDDIDDDEIKGEFDEKDKKRKKAKISHTASPVFKATDNDDNITNAKHPTFPLPNLKRITELNKRLILRGDDPDESLLKTSTLRSLNKLNQSLNGQVNESVQQGASVLKDCIIRYFQYNKENDGLLGMEWEDIRYDIVHGIEDYVCEFKGELLLRGDLNLTGIEFSPRYDYDSVNEKSEYVYRLIDMSKKWVNGSFRHLKFDLQQAFGHK